MNTVRFELIELPYPTLARFGLTQEMIEDLPMRVLDEICDGRHSPVLPVRVRDEKGELIESRSRFALVRRDDGRPDVVFYPVLESSPLERYDEAQQKQLLDGKAIIADVGTADGRHSKAFVQIDEGTKQVMYVPTPIIGRNLQVLAEIMHLGPVEVNGMQNGEPLTLVVDDERHSGYRPARQDRHPLLFGRQPKMERTTQTRVGQIHFRRVRLLGDGRRRQSRLRSRRGIYRGTVERTEEKRRA